MTVSHLKCYASILKTKQVFFKPGLAGEKHCNRAQPISNSHSVDKHLMGKG